MDTNNEAKWQTWMAMPHQEINEITQMVKHGFTRVSERNIETLQALISRDLAVAPDGLSIGAVVCLTLHGWNAIPTYPAETTKKEIS